MKILTMLVIVCEAILLLMSRARAALTTARSVKSLPIQTQAAISLAGQWSFRLDPKHVGEAEHWYIAALPDRITLPGSTDLAGYGDPAPAAGLIGLTRRHAYVGPAWYQREVSIPAYWAGKTVTLFLERSHWRTTAWIDGRKLGTQDSLSVPHHYDLGSQLTPGTHRLTICVDNTLEYDLGPFASAVYEYTQTNWNGLLGKLLLEAHDPISIDRVQVYPNLKSGRVLVKIVTINATDHPVKANLSLSVLGSGVGAASRTLPRMIPRTLPITVVSGSSTLSISLPTGDRLKPWDEFSPTLYTLRVTLESAGTLSQKDTRFGMRDLGERGTQFTWNGRPIFLRGTLECAIFPKTGYPPTDVAAWERICRIIKSYGLNCLRFHSWCPPDAAFTAADQEGVYVQVEAPQANVNVGDVPAREQFIREESLRILAAYGNHPSFAFFAMGNELSGKDALFADWVDLCRKTDARHLYTSSTNGVETSNCEFSVDTRARGISGDGTANDFRAAVEGLSHPLVTHEMGQWTFYPNLAEARKYDGVLAPTNFDQIRADLTSKHLLDQAPEFFEATGRQAVELYKAEIEQILRTPKAGGFHLLDLHDYPGQGTALIGVLDPFWDSKGFITPAEFASFTGPTVPLLRIPKRTYTTDETLAGPIEVANYGPADLRDAEVTWSVHQKDGLAVASGFFPKSTLPTGELTTVGSFIAPLAGVAAPVELVVTIAIQGTKFQNSWSVWVYPGQTPVQPPTDVTTTSDWAAAAAALARGGKVLFHTDGRRSPSTVPSNYTPVFWSPVWFPNGATTMSILCDPKHPALALFPTESYSSWPWYDLMQNTRAMIVDDLPETLHPIVRVVDNFSRNHHLAALFEGRVGQGRLIVSSLNLSTERKLSGEKSGRPASSQIMHSIYAYMNSPRFDPEQDLSVAALAKLLTIPAVEMTTLGAKISRVDSESPDGPASNLLDGDPDTFWHSAWQGGAPPFPHEFTVQFANTVVITGVKVQQRQDMANGYVKSYAIFVSADGTQWGDAVAKGDLAQSGNSQQIDFSKPVSGKSVRFVALSSGTGANFCSLAEFEVIPK